MEKNETGIPLLKAFSLPDRKGINEAYINIMLEEDLPVLCVYRNDQTQKLTPFKPLYENDHSFWHKSGAEEYFLTGYGLKRLKELAIAKTGSWNVAETEEKEITQETKSLSLRELNLGSEYDTIAHLTSKEKVERLNRLKKQLNKLIDDKSKDRFIIAETLAATTKDAAMINHTIMETILNLANDQAKAFSKEVVMYTNEIVKSSALLLSENVLSDELLRTITDRSKGIVFQHMTRVYLNGAAFLAYINNMISSSSALIKIRSSFNMKYRKIYQSLLPHIDGYDITMDHAFMDGLKIIPSDMLFKWSVGFLLHDIGKAADIEYHEGAAAYDREKVIAHVNVGYNSITEKTNYPKEAGLIVGYHHEYFGDIDGYGPFRDDLQEYKSQVADVKQNYCTTYDLQSILDFKALAYFPAKVLEIIDIYDSLTDPRRIYRKPMSSQEALDMLYREFIIKRCKIDPILFDIFSGFIHEKEEAAAK